MQSGSFKDNLKQRDRQESSDKETYPWQNFEEDHERLMLLKWTADLTHTVRKLAVNTMGYS